MPMPPVPSTRSIRYFPPARTSPALTCGAVMLRDHTTRCRDPSAFARRVLFGPRRRRFLLCLELAPEPRGIAFLVLLLCAPDRERVGGDVHRDGGARADVRAVPDRDRGDELRVRADERALPDARDLLLEAV